MINALLFAAAMALTAWLLLRRRRDDEVVTLFKQGCPALRCQEGQ